MKAWRILALVLVTGVLGTLGVVGCAHEGPIHKTFLSPKEKRALQGPVLVLDPMVRCGQLEDPKSMVAPLLARIMADLGPRAMAYRSFAKDIHGYDDFTEHLVKMSSRAGDNGRMTGLMEVEWTIPFLAQLSQLPEIIEKIMNKRSMVPQRPNLVLATSLMCEGQSFTGALRWHMELVLVHAKDQRVLWKLEDSFSSTANETGGTEQGILHVHRGTSLLLTDVNITK